MWRRDALVLGGALVVVAGVASGHTWLSFLASVLGWVLLYAAVRHPAPTDYRQVVAAGAVAAVIVACADHLLTAPGTALLFHVRRELPWFRISPGVEAARGVLLAGCLFAHARLRSRLHVVLASLAAAGIGLLSGLAFEAAGSHSGLWVWNASQVPDWRLGPAWMFVPIAWGATFLLPAYYLMRFSRRVPRQFYPIGVGVRCGTGYVALLLISYAFLLRVYGKAGLH